jgi:Fungal Zn(2)-Cys(6) binuclear cluster domain
MSESIGGLIYQHRCQQTDFIMFALAERLLRKSHLDFSRITATNNLEMSIHRKSCDPCFRARRKCDLRYPVCERCERNSKSCHYKYPSQLSLQDDFANADNATILGPGISPWVSHSGKLRKNFGSHIVVFRQLDNNFTLQLTNFPGLSVPKDLGNLGELGPITGATPSWAWVLEQIGDLPLAFARQAETLFIHKVLFGTSFPRTLRAAFGICAGCVSLNDRNRSVLFQSLDAEITELLVTVSTSTLREDLVRLQAVVLYQIIRFFYGGLEQRIVAERQEFLVRSYGLTLLRRADSELQNAPPTWETWLLAESIRRTVLISFKLYTVYSGATYGICSEFTAIGILPVSTQPSSWNSRGAYLSCRNQEKTTTYGDFTSMWVASPRRDVELYEKFLLVGCKEVEIDQIESWIDR